MHAWGKLNWKGNLTSYQKSFEADYSKHIGFSFLFIVVNYNMVFEEAEWPSG